ncbi:hypothetical protein FB45DRAFT_965102 [Roridomyces roridus]|uniref:Uncharacterized protein n=1 Tax=Roridomyces roridus TaxID=1738132 RepID=A0AAD7AX39_9AGAR|nr:hypothetical protein FB45DRAFT_965102 [Roridomyces roridus]
MPMFCTLANVSFFNGVHATFPSPRLLLLLPQVSVSLVQTGAHTLLAKLLGRFRAFKVLDMVLDAHGVRSGCREDWHTTVRRQGSGSKSKGN